MIAHSYIGVRRYSPSDLTAMLEVRRSAIRRIAACDYSPTQIIAWAPDTDDLEGQAARFAGSQTWVAHSGDALVGFTNLATEGYLDCMYVHADHQNRGIATALLTALEASAAEQNVARLWAEVSITARPFFERRGFTVISPQTVIYRDVAYLNFRMEKQLKGIVAPK